MPDIFISYSRKDSAKAEQLAQMLTAAGLSCWIDREGIDVATSWSGEIVDAIEQCKAFVVMLSPNSVASHNVIKEVSLAAEQHKKILPLDLEPVELPRDLKYHLAGIQRAPMTNIDAIIRALGKLGLEATGAPQAPKIGGASHGQRAPKKDTRTSLIIMPFEDLSQAQDNLWFADGLAGELIDALSHIKSLRILDRKASRELRGVKQSIVELSKMFDTRYFIEGSVRKFGDNIKISVSLLDIETADYLWQESIKGVMNDIFEIQEKVAELVVEALKLHLTSEEDKLVKERGTANAEAYELNIKISDYFYRHTKEGFLITIPIAEKAIALDPHYVNPLATLAMCHIALYLNYDRREEHLAVATLCCDKIDAIFPDGSRSAYPRTVIAECRGDLDAAESIARKLVAMHPDRAVAHSGLSGVLRRQKRLEESIEEGITAHRLNPSDLLFLQNLIATCDEAEKIEERDRWCAVCMPLLQKALLLHPENHSHRFWETLLLCFLGENEAARSKADALLATTTDAVVTYHLAIVYGKLQDEPASLSTFRMAVERGLHTPHLIGTFLPGIDISKVDATEYEETKALVDRILADRDRPAQA